MTSATTSETQVDAIRFRRRDVLDAYGRFLLDWHFNGEVMHPVSGRPVRARLERLGYQLHPRLLVEALSPNARLIYERLESIEEQTGGKTLPPDLARIMAEP